MTNTDQEKRERDVLAKKLATKRTPHKSRSEITKLERPINEGDFREPPSKRQGKRTEVKDSHDRHANTIATLRASLTRPDFD